MLFRCVEREVHRIFYQSCRNVILPQTPTVLIAAQRVPHTGGTYLAYLFPPWPYIAAHVTLAQSAQQKGAIISFHITSAGSAITSKPVIHQEPKEAEKANTVFKVNWTKHEHNETKNHKDKKKHASALVHWAGETWKILYNAPKNKHMICISRYDLCISKVAINIFLLKAKWSNHSPASSPWG